MFSFPLMSANWIEEFHNGRSAGIVLIEFLKLSAMLLIQFHSTSSKVSASLPSYKSGVCGISQSILY